MHFSKMVIDLYQVPKTGIVWKRVQRRKKAPERLLQEALQSPRNLPILGLASRRVRWVGREFQSADFFGIDEKWNLVFIETKVSSQQAHLSHQLQERARFVGMDFRKVDGLIWKYVRGRRPDSFLMAEGLRLRRRARRGSLERAKDVAMDLRRLIGTRRPARVSRVLFLAVSPFLNSTMASRVERLQTNLKRRYGKKRGRLSFSCVLLTPYLEKEAIAVARIEF